METQERVVVRDFALEHLLNPQTERAPGITLTQDLAAAQLLDKPTPTTTEKSDTDTNIPDSTKLPSPYPLPYSAVYLPEWSVKRDPNHYQSPVVVNNTGHHGGVQPPPDITHERTMSSTSQYSQYSTPLSNRSSTDDRNRALSSVSYYRDRASTANSKSSMGSLDLAPVNEHDYDMPDWSDAATDMG